MSFLALSSQKGFLILQKNQLQFQQTCIGREVLEIAQEMQDYLDAGGSEEDHDYVEFSQLDEQYESQQDALEAQLQLIDSQLSSMKQLVNNNIQSSCKLNLVGG